MLGVLRGLLGALICLGAYPVYAQGEQDTVGAEALQESVRDTVRVKILHSNDVYGQLRRQATDEGFLGGMAPRVRLIREIREAGAALVLDAGDAIGPSTLSAWDQGETMVAAMRLAGYTAMTPGNHEFDYGPEALVRRREEAGFPFLAANLRWKAGMEPPVQAYFLVEVEGVKIGILGVISPEVAAQTNPTALLAFEDPLKAARQAVGTLREQGADYVIALVHMEEGEALALARKAAGVDLVVAGGYRGLEQALQVRALTRLVNGVHAVTTPRFGSYVGQVEVMFLRNADGGYRVGRMDAALLPVGGDVPDDSETAALVGKLEAAYAEETGEMLGRIEAETVEAQAEVVANLMRWHTDMEVGVVRRGAFREIRSKQPLYLRDIERFVRFDDALVKMVLTGRQLRTIAKQSRRAKGGSGGLVFAGMDPKRMTVNGRSIQNNEPYQVVTVEVLVGGGDGYGEFKKGVSVIRTGISLRSLLAAWLKGGTLSSAAFRELERKGVWRSGWSVEGAFRRNYVNETTEDYRAQKERVSFLRGETSISWNSATRYFLGYEGGAHGVLFENTTDFGQVGRSLGNLESSSDRLDVDVTYRYRLGGLKVEPILSSGISTAFTRTSGTRPFLWRNSVGFQRRFYQRLVIRFAARGQRNYAADESDFGAEVTLTYQRRLPQGGRFRSKVKSFFGLTDRKVVSIENYNTFSFPLVGELSLAVRQNNFIYRVDKIRENPVSGVAFRTDLTVGFAYGLDWKWF